RRYKLVLPNKSSLGLHPASLQISGLLPADLHPSGLPLAALRPIILRLAGSHTPVQTLDECLFLKPKLSAEGSPESCAVSWGQIRHAAGANAAPCMTRFDGAYRRTDSVAQGNSSVSEPRPAAPAHW